MSENDDKKQAVSRKVDALVRNSIPVVGFAIMLFGWWFDFRGFAQGVGAGMMITGGLWRWIHHLENNTSNTEITSGENRKGV